MKTVSTALLSLLISATQGMAATEEYTNQHSGLLETFFIAFFLLIILFQSIPGVLHFVGIIKNVFSRVDKTTEVTGYE